MNGVNLMEVFKLDHHEVSNEYLCTRKRGSRMLQCIPNAIKDHEEVKEKEKEKNYPQIQINIFKIEEIYFHSVQVIGGGRQSL